MNEYQYTNENGDYRDYWELVNDNGELCKEIGKLQYKNKQLKHIIDELEKWLMDENNQKYSKDIWNYSVNSWVLTKMQELEKGDSNE